MRTALTTIVLLLIVVTLQACALMNPVPSTEIGVTLPPLPVLPSAVRLEHNGVPGLWMDETDVTNLMLWIHNANTSNK